MFVIKHWNYVEMLGAIGLLVGLYTLALCVVAGKRTPKPGEEYDERGPYECNGDCLGGAHQSRSQSAEQPSCAKGVSSFWD